MAVFRLRYYDCDSEDSFFFEGPDGYDFQSKCDEIFEAVKKEFFETKKYIWVSEIVREVKDRLLKEPELSTCSLICVDYVDRVNDSEMFSLEEKARVRETVEKRTLDFLEGN